MFKNDSLKEVFKNKKEMIDTEIPCFDHREQFIRKLNKQNRLSKSLKHKKRVVRIAAILVLSIGISFFTKGKVLVTEEIVATSNLPDEVVNATFYFEGLVKKELERIELERNQETNEIIDEAFKQINALETEQQHLQEQLKSHYDKRFVKALISNFQYRIKLLENVMQQIELTKKINAQQHEII